MCLYKPACVVMCGYVGQIVLCCRIASCFVCTRVCQVMSLFACVRAPVDQDVVMKYCARVCQIHALPRSRRSLELSPSSSLSCCDVTV